MDPPVEIVDGFRNLDPSESMTRTLSQFFEQMLNNDRRVLCRVIDMITAKEPDEQMRFDMLATHISKEDNRHLDYVPWSEYAKTYPELTQINAFPNYEESEVRPMPSVDSAPPIDSAPPVDSALTTRLLSDLEGAVRSNASRELLGRTAETLTLPVDYCEFVKQVLAVSSSNWDRIMFYCEFGTLLWGVGTQAKPLDELVNYDRYEGFEVAAGWRVAEKDISSLVHCFLCRKDNEPWQWRIFFFDIEFAEIFAFENVAEFLSWYSNSYEWVRWDIVERHIGRLQDVCREARAEEEEASSSE